jgi:uncharacterized protein YndB with AHSA1/START domain
MPAALQPVTLDFLATAPIQHTSIETVPHPPEVVFAAIAENPASWGNWFPGFTHTGRYLSDAPHHAGSVREVTMFGNRYRERIIAWEPPHHWAFCVDQATIPIARSLAEEYRITGDGGESTVQWKMAMIPRGPLRAAGPLVDPLFSRLFRRAMQNLSRELAKPYAGA